MSQLLLIPIFVAGLAMVSAAPPRSSGDTDSIVHEIYGDHWVMWDTANDDSPYLYLFMPGSGQLPEVRSEWVLKGAARGGLRAISLAYQNQGMVSSLCVGTGDPDCMERIRLERIYGVDESDLVDCPYEESVVARAVLYAGPFDRDPTIKVDWKNRVYGEAPWVADEPVTPRDRYYSFYHVEDNAPYTFILEDNFDRLHPWRLHLGIDVNAATSIDGTQRYLYIRKVLNPAQSAHTYPLLERFMAVHRYMASYGL